MRRIVHLSDLHFGRARPELLDPLIERVNGLAADLVAISGDLTQRAREHQFRDARAFLDRIESPVLVVPGNHDVPLENLPVRLLRPWRRYRHWISENLEPEWRSDEVTVIGLNTVNPFSWQRGLIGVHAVQRACAAFEGDETHTRVVVAHHPFEHLPGERKTLMRGAEAAIDGLSDCGADIMLTGHLHSWRVEPFAERVGRRGAIQVHAGTGLSNRLRGEENDFNLLTLDLEQVTVERYAATFGGTSFEPAASVSFRLHESGWRTAEADRRAARS